MMYPPLTVHLFHFSKMQQFSNLAILKTFSAHVYRWRRAAPSSALPPYYSNRCKYRGDGIILDSDIRRPRQFGTTSLQLSKAGLQEDEELASARSWLTTFSPAAIPRGSCVLTFSRSSGPGGQNVNKINSKATLRFDLKNKGAFIPSLILQRIVDSSSGYLTKNGSEIVIHSDAHRKQSNNVDECFRKLYLFIVECADLPGETSVEQKEKVQNLKKIESERRIKSKKHHSSKKASRSGRDD